jgi:very-short-patch-repair endonuclease
MSTRKLLEWFEIKYPDLIIERQKKFEWCKIVRKCSFDIVIESMKIIIEIDGRQHKQQVHNWESPEIIQVRDKFKEERAKENGYNVKRILQEDIWYNRNNWEEQMIRILEKNEACS